MKIELKLEVTRGTARRIGIVGAILLVLGAAVTVYANQITFTSGATLTAADLNNNFDELYARTSAKGLSSSMSINATFCGVTSGQYNGAQVGGYTGGKSKCETACSAATAHMCSPEEMSRSLQLGLDVSSAAGGWVATAHYNTGFATNLTDTNCYSWTDATNSSYGPAWGGSSPQNEFVGVQSCDTAQKIVCCN